jgi:hypothetical protein
MEIKTFFKEWNKKKKAKRSLKDLFMEIWNERNHICVECWRILNTPKAHNFAHIKSKWSRIDLKYDKDNIEIKCFKCHFKQDHGLNHLWIDLDL